MKKSLLIVLIAVLIITISAFAFLGYIILSNDTLNNQPDTNNKQEQIKEVEGSMFNANLNDIVLNITNSRGRIKLMKLSLTLKSIDSNIETIVENNKAEFIDKIIQLISARSSEELLTLGGKTLLKEEFLQNFNEIIDNLALSNDEIKQSSIKKVLFTTFVMK
jgi:flagellar FliL protein